jgi:hypothetical protein
MVVFIVSTLFLLIIVAIITYKSVQISKNADVKQQTLKPTLNIDRKQFGSDWGGIMINIGKTPAILGKYEITNGPFECSTNCWSISVNEYPNLFESSPRSFTSVNNIHDIISGKDFVFIVRNLIGAGGYTPVYGIIIDSEGHVLYETPKEFGIQKFTSFSLVENNSIIRLEMQPYFLWSSCMNCALQTIEYIAYDPSANMFISANNRFKSEFTKLLVKYNLIADTKCTYSGKIVPISKLLDSVGPKTKCEDDIISGKSGSANFITIGQFENIRNAIKMIINGDKKSLIGVLN